MFGRNYSGELISIDRAANRNDFSTISKAGHAGSRVNERADFLRMCGGQLHRDDRRRIGSCEVVRAMRRLRRSAARSGGIDDERSFCSWRYSLRCSISLARPSRPGSALWSRSFWIN